MKISSNNKTANKIISQIESQGSAYWNRVREQKPLKLFHRAAKEVPAYKDFLMKNKVNPTKIKTFKDFQLVPPVSKNNYLRQYSMEDLAWGGNLRKPLVWTATSGSTGDPFYFPRGHQLDWEYSILIELFLRNSTAKKIDSTLVIVSFGMGVWIGGLITYKAFEIAMQRNNFPGSIITPGVNKREIFHALKSLSPHFSQTILVGYPPFVKDVLDEAVALENINIKKINLRILNAAESYTEKFRDYIVKKAAVRNRYLDTMNIYGSADIGAMAWETPISILIRKVAMSRRKIFHNLFTQLEKTPTLTQYNPFFVTFEAHAKNILLTGDNALPLIRYAIGDSGGVLGFNEMKSIMDENKVNLNGLINKAGIRKVVYELPFVYVYERNDFSVTLYGLQIFPEFLKGILLEKNINKILTGKFLLTTKFDESHNQYLEINLELRNKKRANKKFRDVVLCRVVKALMDKSSEYKELHNHLGRRAEPRLVFWEAENPVYFKMGIKQKWISR